MPGETISAEQAVGLVKSGMWLDYGVAHCQPDVFDQALAARKDELENVALESTRTIDIDDPSLSPAFSTLHGRGGIFH